MTKGQNKNNLVVSHGVVNPQTITFHSNRICSMQIKKNADYGNSIEQGVSEFGMTYLIIQLQNKLNRLKQLTKGGYKPQVNESVSDTLDDIVGYALHGTIIENGPLCATIIIDEGKEGEDLTPTEPNLKVCEREQRLSNGLNNIIDVVIKEHKAKGFDSVKIERIISVFENALIHFNIEKPQREGIKIPPKDKPKTKKRINYDTNGPTGDDVRKAIEAKQNEVSAAIEQESSKLIVYGIDLTNVDSYVHNTLVLEEFSKYHIPNHKQIKIGNKEYITHNGAVYLVESKPHVFGFYKYAIPMFNVADAESLCKRYFEKVGNENE